MSEHNYKCRRCEEEVGITKYEPMNRVFCDGCYEDHRKDHKELIKEYSKIKVKVMYENALRIMEKSEKVYLYEYLKASKMIYNMAMDRPETFASTHEMIAAIILEEFSFEYEVNYPILQYRVDFYIPELSICLEVDGHLHKHKLEYDSRRDIEIRTALGEEWEVVRIPTKYIEKNPVKIIDAIEGLAKEKRRLREKNLGIMPYGYSKREVKHYDSIIK